MKMCDRCRVPGCLLNYNGKACANARKEYCPDVVFTNADSIREMSDEELAEFLAEWGHRSLSWYSEYGETLAYLQEPTQKEG